MKTCVLIAAFVSFPAKDATFCPFCWVAVADSFVQTQGILVILTAYGNGMNSRLISHVRPNNRNDERNCLFTLQTTPARMDQNRILCLSSVTVMSLTRGKAGELEFLAE